MIDQAQQYVFKKVDVSFFAQQIEAVCVAPGRGYFRVNCTDTNRPAMQLAGYFDHFADYRIQVFGNQEIGYMAELPTSLLEERLAKFFQFDIPCVIVCNGTQVHPAILRHAANNGVPVFSCTESTSVLVHKVVDCLDDVLAPEMQVHANLLDVYNVGVMIRGESGMGKSELALELLKRGHLLVADDVTVVKKVNEKRLIGYAPKATRHLIEIRGLGILDVKKLYGMAAVLDQKSIDVIIDMEMWDTEKGYERLGFDVNYDTLMGVQIPRYVMPVRPGRNLAVVVEATAMDFRMKKSGFKIEEEMEERLKQID